MKKTTFNKKLTLNKKTIADLGSTEMKVVKGGATEFPCTFDTCTMCTCNTRCPTCPEISCFIYC